MRFWLRLVPLLLLAACNRNARTCKGAHCPCYTMQDCGESAICFLGTCQSPGYNISTVYVDLLPSSSSGLAAQSDERNPRDLSSGLNFDIYLRAAATLTGKVVADSGVTLGGLLSAKVHQANNLQVLLPSALSQTQAVLAPDGSFSLAVIPDTYDLTLAPSQYSGVPLPPQTLAGYAIDSDSHYSFAYPDTTLATVGGVITAQTTSSSVIAGAVVNGVGITATGFSLPSTTAITDSSGAYQLTFLPGAVRYTITVHPGTPPQGNPQVPTMTFAALATTGSPPTLGDLVLNVPIAPADLTIAVVDTNRQPVSGAAVFLDGLVGGGPVQGTFSLSSTTDNTGAAHVAVFPGTYTLNVIPSGGARTAASTTALCVLAGTAAVPTACPHSVRTQDTFEIVAGDMVTASGRVLSHTGSPVANARVSYIPLNDAARRQFAGVSQRDGTYSLAIDPPTAGSATLQYEVQVEPDTTTGLPRHRELLLVGTEAVHHDIQLFEPSFVYGVVYDPLGSPLADVTIALYSSDLGSAGQPLLVGLGKSSTSGQFVIPLPIGND